MEERDPLVPRYCKHDIEGQYQSRSKDKRITITDAVLKGGTVSLPSCAEFGSDKSENCIGFPTENGGLKSSVSFPARSMFSKVLYSGVPLKFLASMFGFWPIKRKWQFIIFAIIMIVSCAIFTLAAYVCSSCYVALNSANYTCVITGRNEKGSRGILIVILGSFLYLLAPFAVVLSNLLFFHYVVKSVRKEGVLSLMAAYNKTNDFQWLLINVQILATFIGAVLFLRFYFDYLLRHSVDLCALQVCFVLSDLNVNVTCWMFAMITCALTNKVSSCYRAIRMRNEGSLADVIDIHQNLCDDVFSTCRALQPWFVSHWIFFGVSTAGTLFLAVLDFKNNSYIFFPVLKLVYLFLVPCFYAARLTAKCQDVLREFNHIRARDLGVTHPLHSRVTLNHFLFYALQARCGFRVFSFNFGDSFAWMSLVFGVLASVANLLVYHNI